VMVLGKKSRMGTELEWEKIKKILEDIEQVLGPRPALSLALQGIGTGPRGFDTVVRIAGSVSPPGFVFIRHSEEKVNVSVK
jgi:hypothetical protein